MAANTLCVWVGCCGGNRLLWSAGSGSGFGEDRGGAVGVAVMGFAFVERRFFGARSRWPCAVAMYGGKCLETAGAVMPGHVTKFLLRMAWSHVEVTGL
jgi:hypothetical protein